MSSNLLSRVRSSGTTLVCDIGSGSVAVALIELTAGSREARVLFSRRDALSQEDRDPKRLLQALIGQLTTTLQEVHTMPRGGAIRQATVVLHTPWVNTRTGSGTLRLGRPTRINRDILDQVTRKALEDTQHVEGESEERVAIRLELNGYPTTQPLGKIAETVTAIGVESQADAPIATGVRHAFATVLPECAVTIRSHTLIALSAIRESLGSLEDFVILDIGSEQSSFSVVREGMLRSTGVIEFGARQLIRALAAAIASTPEEVLSLLRMMLEGTCAPRTCDKINVALAQFERDFVSVFGRAFNAGETGTARLPNTLFASITPELAVWLGNFLEKIDFGQFTVTGRPFLVTHLEAKHFGVRVQMPPEMQADAALAAGIAFVVSRS